jgi:hypothetical protein
VLIPTGCKGRLAGTYEKVVSGLPTIVAYALGDASAGGATLTNIRIILGARNCVTQFPQKSRITQLFRHNLRRLSARRSGREDGIWITALTVRSIPELKERLGGLAERTRRTTSSLAG